ncbi:SDR family oxidoreductase [Streptomyces sp. NPDC054833]
MPDTQRPVAFVSGGSRGIGRAIVSRLAHEGFDGLFRYRSGADAADEVVESATDTGARVVPHRVDVAAPEEVRAFTDWGDVMATSLDGTYNMCRSAVFSFMKCRVGCVVTLSSMAGGYGNATQTNYAASKAGIIGFTKSLAKECGKYGVRANVVAPGLIETDMTAGLTEAVREDILDGVPPGRFGTPDDVADLVSVLVSDRARHISGQVLGVDGGLVIGAHPSPVHRS